MPELRPIRAPARVLLAALALAAGGCGQDAARDGARAADHGAELRVDVVDLPQLKQALASTGARATVVNFWATWCGPCVAELPDLLAVARPYAAADLAVLLVDYDLRTPETKLTAQSVVPFLREFARKHAIDRPILAYDDGVLALADAYGLAGPLPSTIVLDAKGNVIARHEGAATREEFEQLLRGALQGALQPR